MIVDTHTHLLAAGHWPAAWWDHVAADWAAAAPDRTPEQVRDRIEPGLLDPDGSRMVARMDSAEVDVSVILPIDWGPERQSLASVTDANDHAAAIAASYPGRFASFVGIDPRRPEAVDVMQQRLEDGTLHGLKLYPGCGWHPASDQASAVYEVAQAAGVPVLFHTGDPLPILDRALSDPAHLLEVARGFTDLRIWLGHAGAPDRWDEACTVLEVSRHAKLEMSVWLWDDSDPRQRSRWRRLLAEARDRFGAERIMFGSDHVSGRKVRGEQFLPTILEAYRALAAPSGDEVPIFTPEELAWVLGENAARDLPVGWARPTGKDIG